MKESRVARRTDVERVEEYLEHQRQAQEACSGDAGGSRNQPWLKNMLATFYGETNHFTEPHRLLQVTMMIQRRQRLAPQTIVTYLASLKKFVDYLVIRDNIDAARIQAAMNEVKGIYSTSAAADSRRKADERFKLVPSHNIVVTRHEQVLKLLQENLEEESLSLKEEKALNYFLLQARLNCRNQPIMNLTWEMLEEIQRNGSVLTSKHKTGQYYDVALRVEPDQIPLLYHLRGTYRRELGTVPVLIFATRKGTADRSIASEIYQVFAAKFGDSATAIRFNSNSMRKYREGRMQQLRQNDEIAADVMTEHLHQTGHTQQTAEKYYMSANMASRHRLLDHLVKDLRAVSEEDEVPEPADVTVPTESTVSTIGDATPIAEREARQKEIERAERG